MSEKRIFGYNTNNFQLIIIAYTNMVQNENNITDAAILAASTPKQSTFKFGVYVQKQIIAERIFTADVYNPSVRYSVNLRPLASRIMSDFQYVLRLPNRRLNFVAEIGKDQNDEKVHYNLDQYYYNGLTLPKSEDEPEDDFSFSLKLNDNFIIERNFKVPNFNYRALHSVDIVERVDNWVEKIQSHIFKADTKLMWEEYELVSRYNISYQDVRNLAPEKRELMLRKIQAPVGH